MRRGKPVAYATVVDIPATGHRTRSDLYQRDTTNEDGHFRIRGLNPGKYMVLALQGDVRQPEFLNAYESRGQNVQLDEGARIDEGARTSIGLKAINSDSRAQ